MAYGLWHIVKCSAVLLFFCAFVLSASQASAVGVGVKPKEINLDIRAGKQTETEILVVNVSSEPAFYEVYPDALENKINLEPSNFRLEPDESQIVALKAKINTPGRFGTNLSIVARPVAASSFPAGSGVKVPISIIVSGLPFLGHILVVFSAACLVLIFVVILLYKKKKFQAPNNLKT